MLFRLNKSSLGKEKFLDTFRVQRNCVFFSHIRVGHYHEFNE